MYSTYCASCHGEQGDGQGRAAYLVFPKPRNFERGLFKLRSTPEGMLPTDDDLIRSVTQGIPGTSMLDFAGLLSDAQIRAVVEHVKALTPAFAEAQPIRAEQLLSIPDPPPPTPELVELGRETYEKLRCAQCHGPAGRGDGPAAPTLEDSEGNPFPAADFTYGIFKSGGTPADLYRTFLTGMAGTPMPSYASALTSDQEAWALVYYILSLTPDGEARPARGDRGPVAVVDVADTSPAADPFDILWEGVEPYRVALHPLWYRNEYPAFVHLRVLRDAERLAVLLEWEDASEDAEALQHGGFADGAAVQLALVDPPPFVGMGQSGAGGQTEIWYWRADRQAAAEGEGPRQLRDLYPHMMVDRYPFSETRLPEGTIHTRQQKISGQEAPFMTARDVGNDASQPELMSRPVHQHAASGFGSLSSLGAAPMRAQGEGAWKDGVYRVVFSAALRPRSEDLEADLTAGTVPMAVAIWNGEFGDRNGTKLVTQWVKLAAGEETQIASRDGDDAMPAGRAKTRRGR